MFFEGNTILWVYFIQDYYSGRSKKYGFVEFERSETMDKVLAEPVHFIDGTQVRFIKELTSKSLCIVPRVLCARIDAAFLIFDVLIF